MSGFRGAKNYEAVTTPEAYSELVTKCGQALQSAMVSAVMPRL